MKKYFKTLSAVAITVLTVGLTACGNSAATKGAEASNGSSSVSESFTSETVESAAADTKETAVSKTAASSEAETAVSEATDSTEAANDLETMAAEIAEEIGLDEEMSANLLEELQIAWDDLSGDEETFYKYVEIVKEEFAYKMEKKATATPQPPKEEINWDMAALPEDRVWVDDLHNKLISDDYEGVLAILKDDTIAEKAEPYKYKNYVYDSYGYKLVTTDGKFVGLQLPIDISAVTGRYVWYSDNEETDYGFMNTEYGDKELDYMYNSFSGQWEYYWFDGKTLFYPDGSTYEFEEGDIYMVWEM